MYGCTNEELYCSASLSHSASGRCTEATLRCESGLVLREPLQFFLHRSTSSSFKSFFFSRLHYMSACTVGEAHVWCIQRNEPNPNPPPSSRPCSVHTSERGLTWVSRKAYWVQRHRSRHQQFGDGAEVGFHGDALQLHWIWGQEFCGVYWVRERRVGRWWWCRELTRTSERQLAEQHCEYQAAAKCDSCKAGKKHWNAYFKLLSQPIAKQRWQHGNILWITAANQKKWNRFTVWTIFLLHSFR